MSEDHIIIETPEHIQLQYELAGIGSRALALLFDTLVQVLITGAIIALVIWLVNYFDIANLRGVAMAILTGTLGFLGLVGYFVISEMTMNGQSPGKRLAGLRVVRDDGTPITFLDSAIRNLIRVVDLLPFIYTVGMIAVFFSRRAKRLGDMAAGTIVVKERVYEVAELATDNADLAAAPTTSSPLSPEVEGRLRSSLHLLTNADFDAATHYLERRYELANEIRTQLAAQVALPMIERMPTVSTNDFSHPEVFLEAIVRMRREKPF